MSQQPLSEPIAKTREINDVRALPVLPVRDTVLFLHAVLPLTVGRESSVQLINSLGEDKTIVVVAQREARVDNPQPSDLYTVGTSARRPAPYRGTGKFRPAYQFARRG